MKEKNTIINILLVIGVLISCNAIADEKSAVEDKRILQIEIKLKKGSVPEYYNYVINMVNKINSTKDHNKDDVFAAKLLDNLLQKKTTIESDNKDIIIMKQLSLYLMASPTRDPALVKNNCLLLSNFLGRIRDEIIPGFTAFPVSLNTPPPPPELVDYSNHEEIKLYEAVAREDNMKKSFINIRQSILISMDNTIGKLIIKWLAKQYKEDKINRESVDNYIIDAHLNDAEIKYIIGQ